VTDGGSPQLDIPIYQVDAMVRRATALQHTREPLPARELRRECRQCGARVRRAILELPARWTQAVVWYGVVALVLFISVILTMAFLTLAERRVLGLIQARIGPNRVGPFGLLQPFADVLKLLVKEIVIPSSSNKFLFLVAPISR